MVSLSTTPPLAEACQACEGRKLICRTVTEKRWLFQWKVQCFRLCWACGGTGKFRAQNQHAVNGREEVNMAGQHRKTADTKKECKWCKGEGGFQTGDIYIRCGRCARAGSAERRK